MERPYSEVLLDVQNNLNKRIAQHRERIRGCSERISQHERDRQVASTSSKLKMSCLEAEITELERQLAALVSARKESRSAAPKAVLKQVRSKIHKCQNDLRIETNQELRDYQKYSRMIDVEARWMKEAQADLEADESYLVELAVRESFTQTSPTH